MPMCVEIASGTAIDGLRAGGLTDVTPGRDGNAEWEKIRAAAKIAAETVE